MADVGATLLELRGLVSGYGKKQILNGVSAAVNEGEVVAVIGHNGAGKSTLLKAAFGMIALWSGQVLWQGRVIPTPTPRDLLAMGICYTPQGNVVFNDLTVWENLDVAAMVLNDRKAREESMVTALAMYPVLQERQQQRAGTLSGGEKQMVALASSLMLKPKLMMLDEPSLGLAPPLVTSSLQEIRRIADETGTAILIVEQKVREVLRVADRVYVLRNGKVSWQGPAVDLRQDDDLLRSVYL